MNRKNGFVDVFEFRTHSANELLAVIMGPFASPAAFSKSFFWRPCVSPRAISQFSFERKGTSPQENRELAIGEKREQLTAAAFGRTYVDEMVKADAKDVGAFRLAFKDAS